jgi:hypothetical protein
MPTSRHLDDRQEPVFSNLEGPEFLLRNISKQATEKAKAERIIKNDHNSAPNSTAAAGIKNIVAAVERMEREEPADIIKNFRESVDDPEFIKSRIAELRTTEWWNDLTKQQRGEFLDILDQAKRRRLLKSAQAAALNVTESVSKLARRVLPFLKK